MENEREGNVSGFLPLGVGERGSAVSGLGFEDTWQGPRLWPYLGTHTRHLAAAFASLTSLSFLSPSPIAASPALSAYTEG